MCIHRITHWQSCHHERTDGVDICKNADSQGLDPAKCPEGEDIFREGGAGDDCRICADRDRERRDDDHYREMHEHSRDRDEHYHREKREHSLDSREESLDAVSSVEREERGRERHREDRHDSREKDDRDGGDDRDGKGKKDGKHKGSWDAAKALGCITVAHLASK